MKKTFLLFLLFAAPLAAAVAVPNKITYQGRLMKSGLTAAGPHIFRLISFHPLPPRPSPAPNKP